MSALVTAAEAQALLDAAPAGPYEACHPDDMPGRSIVRGGREVRPPYDAFVVALEDRPRVALAELFAASPALARTVIAQAAEIATLRAAYASDLAGLRAEVRRADEERATWRDLRDAARECLDALEAPAPVWDADESEHDEHAARLEVARVALRALVGGAS